MENAPEIAPKKKSVLKRIVKTIFYLGLTFVLICVTLVSLLFIYQDEVKAALLGEINKHLKSEVTIDPKNIDLTILKTFPDCSMEFKNVLMLEALQIKKRDTLLFAEQLNLHFSISDLWNKKYDIKKLLFLGSSCIYPKMCPQPIKEEYLLSGYLEESNDAYAIAKIAGIKMCQSYNLQYETNFISVMPTNMFGIGDNYHPENSHVIPGLIRRFHDAKITNQKDVICWGDGTPMREFQFPKSQQYLDSRFLLHEIF